MSRSSSSGCGSAADAVESARSRVLALLTDLDDAERDRVERWLSSAQYTLDVQMLQQLRRAEGRVEELAARLRSQLSLAAVLPSESVTYPARGDLADCTPHTTLHVDEFLYDNRRLDRLVERGKLSRHYCVACGSKDVKEMTVISHSVGRAGQLYMFKYLLPRDLSGKRLVDVGSRLGSILYGAYYFTNVSKIIGIEMNKDLCELQDKCISEFKLDPERIQVINSDIMEQPEAVAGADVMVINVVDFFVDAAKQIEMWRFFKSTMRSGTLVVAIRSVADTWSALGVYEEFADWLSVEKPAQIENEIFLNFDENDYTYIYFYKVK